MKKYIQLFALSLLVIIAVIYTACQKEDAIWPSTQLEEPTDAALLLTQTSDSVGMEQSSPAESRASYYLSFKAFNYQNKYIRHQNSLGYITPISSNLDKLDATFYVVPALNGKSGYISFQSKNYPWRYLRHEYSRIKLAPYQNTTLYKNDASFRVANPLAMGLPSYKGGGVSFESYNYPTYYIRHKNSELWIDKIQNTSLYKSDATFIVTNPLAN